MLVIQVLATPKVGRRHHQALPGQLDMHQQLIFPPSAFDIPFLCSPGKLDDLQPLFFPALQEQRLRLVIGRGLVVQRHTPVVDPRHRRLAPVDAGLAGEPPEHLEN